MVPDPASRSDEMALLLREVKTNPLDEATREAKVIQALVADLESPRFPVAERATKELACLGSQPREALRAALGQEPFSRRPTTHRDPSVGGRMHLVVGRRANGIRLPTETPPAENLHMAGMN